MIRDEEQKAQELEREIALMQCKGHPGLQHEAPLQQRAQLEDTREDHFGLQHGPPCNTARNRRTRASPSATSPSRTPRRSKGSTISMSEVPWRHTCK
jgi:predicted nucleic acid-binding Zn ribbon protein